MRVLLIVLALAGFSRPAAALSDADRSAIQSTIEQQLNAFMRDDGAAAYSFAAPNIKSIFPSDDIFMQMVRQGYKPVYRWKSHEFGKAEETSQGLTQAVDIVDADGEFWTAVYTLAQQPDGSWKITACYLVKKPGVGA